MLTADLRGEMGAIHVCTELITGVEEGVIHVCTGLTDAVLQWKLAQQYKAIRPQFKKINLKRVRTMIRFVNEPLCLQ